MPEESIGALWERTKGNNTYMTGVIKGIKVVVFKNKQKKEGKQPDWRVFIWKEKKPKKDEEEVPF